jgi:hypothetical protein
MAARGNVSVYVVPTVVVGTRGTRRLSLLVLCVAADKRTRANVCTAVAVVTVMVPPGTARVGALVMTGRWVVNRFEPGSTRYGGV